MGTFPLIAHSMVGYGRLKETIRVREREIKDANSFKMQRFYHAFVGLTRSLVRVSRPIDRNNGSIL